MALKRLTLRARLLALAAIGAFFTLLVGGVALACNAQIAAVNAAEVRLGDAQAQVLEASRHQRQIRAQVWFAYLASAGTVEEDRDHVVEEYDAAAAGLRAAADRLHAMADQSRSPQPARTRQRAE